MSRNTAQPAAQKIVPLALDHQRTQDIHATPGPLRIGGESREGISHPESSRLALLHIGPHQLIGAVAIERYHHLLATKLLIDQPWRARETDIDVIIVVEDTVKVC